ncbi:hypothetical protein LTR53_001057 [Teratosphaeriaceae sp. CCFEE 6253]|nr:hypothetical protein LTR53_001057 [Teratosphaeriaceae sp. CCFEE 6253]
MDALSKGMGSLLLDPEYADMKILCQDQTYPVHRAIVCSKSPVLAAVCKEAFSEPGDVILQHDVYNAETLHRMLTFMYTGDYTVAECLPIAATEVLAEWDERTKTPEVVVTHPAVAHVLVYAIAVLFEIPQLQILACEKFGTRLAYVHVEDFAVVAHSVYHHNVKGIDLLRAAVLRAAIVRIDELVSLAAFLATIAEQAELQPFVAALLPAVAGAANKSAMQAEADWAARQRQERKVQKREEKAVRLKHETISHKNEINVLKLLCAEREEEMKAMMTKWDHQFSTPAPPMKAPAPPAPAAPPVQPAPQVTDQHAKDLWSRAEVLRKNLGAVQRQLNQERADHDQRYAAQVDTLDRVNGAVACRQCRTYDAKLKFDDRGAVYGTTMLQCRKCGAKQYGPPEV